MIYLKIIFNILKSLHFWKNTDIIRNLDIVWGREGWSKRLYKKGRLYRGGKNVLEKKIEYMGGWGGILGRKIV